MSTSGNSSSSAGFPRPATAHPGGSSSGGGYQQPRQPPSYTKPFAMSGSSSGMDDAAFTQEMRDRQARGKDPDGSEGSDLSDRDTGDTPAKLRLGRIFSCRRLPSFRRHFPPALITDWPAPMALFFLHHERDPSTSFVTPKFSKTLSSC
ncbi:hypothetical protein B0H63DRAFT_147778 [Podospora didyma]|uniref:Uncharacterized protein n=1 Tax=Podospora didyma TaxID=330526 RepID=A0AAE0U1F0_9PEZI|nr:hypothetical protein B0H63DRAFT_147778 [Podospora didyma]